MFKVNADNTFHCSPFYVITIYPEIVKLCDKIHKDIRVV